ncbi:hypothetical protein HDU85_007647 [Gaertneriomyces sp. JEL0708]|nr:hypothetical protein HDU85_007647 [Gaertneriomyces sp. JEL0708]
MSIFNKETIQAVAESTGITLKDDVAAVLLQDMEYRVREIVYEASKFMRHGKRSKLTSEDINHALRVRNVEPLYGYTAGSPAHFSSVTHGQQHVHYVNDQEVDLEEIVNGPLPPVPLDVNYTAHWLAVDGVQPAIVQNPTGADVSIPPSRTILSASNQQVVPSVAHQDTPVEHVITRELQLYYEKTTECILSPSEEDRTIAINSLATDAAVMKDLAPYYVEFIADQLSSNLKNLTVARSMMRLTRAILDNPSNKVETVLHQLIPSILTCIVHKSVGVQTSPTSTFTHFDLRELSAALIAHILHRYSSSYTTLHPRITKTLLRAFIDSSKSLPTLFGALVGLAAIGRQTVQVILLPNLPAFEKRVTEAMAGTDTTRKDGEVLWAKMTQVLVDYWRAEQSERTGASDSAEDLRREIAEKCGGFSEEVIRSLGLSTGSDRDAGAGALDNGELKPMDMDLDLDL